MILHELIPQIPLFWNYENQIHAYLKSRAKKIYNKLKFEKSAYLKENVASLFKNMIFNDLKP